MGADSTVLQACDQGCQIVTSLVHMTAINHSALGRGSTENHPKFEVQTGCLFYLL